MKIIDKKPNLFEFATKELSQDAFICWLLSWSKPNLCDAYKDLNDCAVSIINCFFEKQSMNMPELKTVEVIRQYCNIDVLCIINDTYAIIIEDKTSTSNHSNQLNRYRDIVKNIKTESGEFKYEEKNIIGIYFKTHDQDDFSSVVKDKYHPFSRGELLDILEGYDIKNDIFLDFKSNLKSLEDSIESYRVKPVNEWDNKSWIGFYKYLQNSLGDLVGEKCWNKVNNPRGGFYGFWWNWNQEDEYGASIYMQIESVSSNTKLCFKVAYYDEDKSIQSYLRNKWKLKFKNNFSHEIITPKGRAGKRMTVATLNKSYIKEFDNGLIDLDATLKYLKQLSLDLTNFVNDSK